MLDCRVGKGNAHPALHPPCPPALHHPHPPRHPTYLPRYPTPATHTTIPPASQHGSSSSSRRLTLAGSAQVQAEVAARHQALAVAVAVAVVVAFSLLHQHTPQSSCTPHQTAFTTGQDQTMQGQQEEGTRDGIRRAGAPEQEEPVHTVPRWWYHASKVCLYLVVDTYPYLNPPKPRRLDHWP